MTKPKTYATLVKMSTKRLGLAATAVIAAILGLASFAWACTDFTKIDSITPATDSAAIATVKGSGAAAGSIVELRWNALNGPVIARAVADATGAYRADAAIPEVPAGIYTVLASDGMSSVGRAAYEVAPTSGGAVAAPTTSGDLPIQVKPAVGLTQSTPSHLPSVLVVVVSGAGLLALAAGTMLLTTRNRRALAHHHPSVSIFSGGESAA